MNVYIIGVGPGNGRYLIKESEEKIENADIIIGAKRLIKPYCNKKTFAAITPFDIISIIKSNNQCENIAVLMSGDSSFYSGTKKLVLELEKELNIIFCRGFQAYHICLQKQVFRWMRLDF